MLSLTGCFDLRQPAKPIASTEWTPPTDPAILLSNFRQAVQSLNTLNYERCFNRAGYRFQADPAVALTNSVFANWTLTEEREYLNKLSQRISPGSNNRLVYTDSSTQNFSADSLEFIASYRWNIFHSDTAYAQYTFEGQMRFILLRGTNGDWTIRSWADTRRTTNPCWTELKGWFINR